jgi:hypothetical protein
MDKEAESLGTKANSVQCKRHDASYLPMSYVCNLFAIRLEDVIDKSGRRQGGKQHVEREDDMLDGLLCIQSASDGVHHLYLSL